MAAALRQMLISARSKISQRIISRCYSIYEPDYLEAMKPKYPLYPTLNVQIKGYDYPVLEKYQCLVNKVADLMDFDIEDSFAMPAKDVKIVRFKPESTVTDEEYVLKIYERDVKITNVPSVRLPIFIRILEAALPEGVSLEVDEHNPEKEKLRFVPDKQLLDLKQELEQIRRK